MLEFREAGMDEIVKMRDLDRSEVIRTGYRLEAGVLVELSVNWDDDGWREGDGDHSYGEMIRGTREYMALDGTAFGAFDGDRLVGLAVYRPRLTPDMGQLAGLHVSNGYRRQGVASRLFEDALALARADGADRLYVSATPSGSAVGFYLSKGFEPTTTPDPELLAKEPEDVHMVLRL